MAAADGVDSSVTSARSVSVTMARSTDPEREIIERAPRSVLVVPFADGIGDFIMLLPLLRHIRRHFPGALISVAASERSAQLLDEDDDRVQVRTPSWLRAGPRPRGGPLRRLVPQSLLAGLAGLALRAELGAHDRTLNLFHWWESGLEFHRHWTPQIPTLPGAVHTMDALADRLGRELGRPLVAEARRPRVNVRRAAAAWADRWWEAASFGDSPVVALVPESNMAIKRWPLHRWAWLADRLAGAGCRVLLVAPPAEAGEAVSAALAGRPAGHPVAVLRESLDRVAAVLARCRLVAGVDTGLLHLAPAVGTRYVGLFGPTNPLVTGPYSQELGESLVAPFAKGGACRGCWRQFKYIDDRCAALGSPSCIGHLAPEAVLAACLRQLALAAPAPTTAGVVAAPVPAGASLAPAPSPAVVAALAPA